MESRSTDAGCDQSFAEKIVENEMASSNTKKILLTGEDQTLEQLLATVVSPSTIQTVPTNQECLERVKMELYDLVITDFHTSAAEDVDLLKQIREIRPETKVIAMADESTPEDVIQLIKEHAFSFFSHAFDPEQLLGMVADALELPGWKDDIEILSARPEWIALRLHCRKLTTERLLQFMRELEMDLPVAERENIGTAFREMLLNAIEHGAKYDPRKTVDVSYVRTSRVIIYQIRDPGQGFSFEQLPHAAISNPPDNPAEHILYRMEHGLRAGGFGILMVNSLVDELFYNEKGNEVLMIKFLAAPATVEESERVPLFNTTE